MTPQPAKGVEKLHVMQTFWHPCPQLHLETRHNTTQTSPQPIKQNICSLSTGAQLSSKTFRKTLGLFFSRRKIFNRKMTNNTGRSKFPDALQLLLTESRGSFMGNAVSVERRPTEKEQAASKEGSSLQEAQQQTFPSQNTWVWLHSMKS